MEERRNQWLSPSRSSAIGAGMSVSGAPRRTMCTKCKTNLRVERDEVDPPNRPAQEMAGGGGLATLAGIVIAVGLLVFGWRAEGR
jgi:hypothetical protein